jgi:hypothetical protein
MWMTGSLPAALGLLAVQGALGAFDTAYYHEWRARLPAHGARVGAELKLHASRDFIYAIIFGTLPAVEWRGTFTWALAALFLAEIAITLADFIVEDRVRRPLGGVYGGERATHAIMGIVYGAVLAELVPVMVSWASLPTELVATTEPVDPALAWTLWTMSAGVFVSGLRDLGAALELPGAAFPWPRSGTAQP